MSGAFLFVRPPSHWPTTTRARMAGRRIDNAAGKSDARTSARPRLSKRHGGVAALSVLHGYCINKRIRSRRYARRHARFSNVAAVHRQQPCLFQRDHGGRTCRPTAFRVPRGSRELYRFALLLPCPRRRLRPARAAQDPGIALPPPPVRRAAPAAAAR